MEQATDRWIRGEHAEDYPEPFAAFTARVEAALERRSAARHGTTAGGHLRRPDLLGRAPSSLGGGGRRCGAGSTSCA